MNPLRKVAIGGTLAAAALAGGALGATLFGTANAASTSNTSTTAAAATAAQTQPSFPPHGSAEHEGQEKAVTGDAATKAQAAAVKSVGSGTAGAVTTDFTGNGYEVTVTKPDGSQVDVHLDNSFNAMQGGGHPGPGGANDTGGGY
jgi:hypothetical protein